MLIVITVLHAGKSIYNTARALLHFILLQQLQEPNIVTWGSLLLCVCAQGRKVHYKRQNNHTGTRRGSEVWPITILSCGRINITIIIIMELKWDFTFPNRLLWGFTFHNHRSRKTYINLSWRRRDDGLFGEATTAEKVFLGTTGRRFYSNTHYGCTMKSNWLSRKAK